MQSQSVPQAQAQPQAQPQPQAQAQPQPHAQPQTTPQIPLTFNTSTTYTYLSRLVGHMFRAPDFPRLPQVLVSRSTHPTLPFACCILSSDNVGPTVLVAAQQGATREEAMGKMIGVLEERAAKQIKRAEGLDRARSGGMPGADDDVVLMRVS
jgi:hypothetical protein